MRSEQCDVFIIGGGPAGATVGTLLAQSGLNVVIAEKESFPRFHIGESLLPHNLPLLDQLGVRSAIQSTSIVKRGIEFVSPTHGKSVRFDFARALDRRHPYAFQVRRSEFDEILLRNAESKGVEVLEKCRVTAVELEGSSTPTVTAQIDGSRRSWKARFVVDASGRDTVIANKLRTKERHPRNASAAVFGHFRNARRLEGDAEGNISIIWFDRGWFWFIPLADGTTSIGAVCAPEVFKSRKGDMEAFFNELIASSLEVSDRLKDAVREGGVTATGNYSYLSSQTSGRNFLMVGDAAAFVDPVFSTGVYLAMRGAFQAAGAVKACLAHPERQDKLLKRYDRNIVKAADAFTWFIYRIRQPAMRDLFMAPRNMFRVEEAVLLLLAGGIDRRFRVQARLYLFRGIYYLTKAIHFCARLTRKKDNGAQTGLTPSMGQ